MKRLLYLLLITILITGCGAHTNKPTYEWNGGHCSECGGELIYESTSDKNNYICSECGKRYRFDSIGKKE